MTETRHPLVCPDLGLIGSPLEGTPLVVGEWLVRAGTAVRAGDRVVEIVAGEVLFDVSSPVDGTLVGRQVRSEDVVQARQLLAYIERSSP